MVHDLDCVGAVPMCVVYCSWDDVNLFSELPYIIAEVVCNDKVSKLVLQNHITHVSVSIHST